MPIGYPIAPPSINELNCCPAMDLNLAIHPRAPYSLRLSGKGGGHMATKIDYSRLFGFDMVSGDIVNGVDFQSATVGAKLGAKIGKTTTVSQMIQHLDLPLEVAGAAGPIMRGLGGRKVTPT
jgi:hypothetical protein